MEPLIEAIRAAVTVGATSDQKRQGAEACRTILTALDAEPGKPLATSTTGVAHALAGMDPGTALDLLIAKLTAALPKDGGAGVAAPRSTTTDRGLRIAFVTPPPRPRGPRQRSKR